MRFLPLIAITLACLPQVALAGAWTLAPGEGQVIITSGKRTAPISAMFSGLPQDDTTELSVNLEYGLLEKLTLGASGAAEYSQSLQEIDLRVGVHARYRLWQSPSGGVYSVQAGASAPVNDWIGNPLGLTPADSGVQAELRLLYGRSWLGDWGNTFVNVETAYRWYEKQDDEIHIDTTLGHAFSRRFMVLGSVWARVPVGQGEASLKLAPSVAWTMWPRLGPNDKKDTEARPPRTLQFGLTWDALRPEDGLGFTLSVWNRF